MRDLSRDEAKVRRWLETARLERAQHGSKRVGAGATADVPKRLGGQGHCAALVWKSLISLDHVKYIYLPSKMFGLDLKADGLPTGLRT